MPDENGFASGGPCERFRIFVSMFNPFVDCGFEFRDVVENTSPYTLSGDFSEEPLDEIEPGAGRRSEVQDKAFVSCQPALHGRCLVGGVVVEDQMQIEMGGGLAINLPEEGQELVCPMAGQTFADDFAGRDVERGKKRRSAVALLIMGHGSGAAFLQRQARLGAIESLNLAFFVDGQHKRPLRRVEVEADDVLDLNGEVGIGRNLKTFDEMRLEIVFGPDALHARMADTNLFGHATHAPVRGVDGTLFHGLLDDLEFDRCADWFPAGRFGATFHEAFDTGFGEILLPAPNRGLGDANLVHDRRDAVAIRCHEDDPCAFDDLLACVSIGNQPL